MSTTITPTEQTIDINVTEDVIDINVTNNIVDVNATTEQINIEVAGAYPLPATISSVFGRTGAIVATIGDYNTSLVTENTNLYFTNARARSAISLTTSGTSGAATYDSGTGVLNVPQYQGGVTSFNTRTGAISLTSADVSGALTYVPYNSSNPSGYISGITSGNVTTALGYTPVTNARTLTINGTTFDLTADRSWTITAGAVSSVFGRTGAVVAANGDYTTSQVTEVTNLYYTDARSRAALSFVAGSGTYNSTTGVITIPTNNNQITNGAGYITSSALSTYVPYTGATTNLNLGANNLLANNAFLGFSSITASGTQVVLTVASVPTYIVSGSGGQTIKLPDATTLPNGANYVFNNNQSSGAILVNNNSNTLVVSIPSGGYCTLELTDNSIAAGSWDRHFEAPSNVSWSTNTLDYAGSITSATWNGSAVQPNRGGTGQSTYTDGQLLIGNSTGNTLTKANLSAGTGITITNGGGSISIASSITQYTDALARASISLTTTGTSGAATYNSTTGVLNIPQYSGGSGMVYPAAGIALSTGTGWGTSITDNSANWNTAYTNRITSLTTTGSSGAATLTSNTLNIPNYTLAGLGGISLTSLSATTPLNYNNTTGVFTITQASASANGFLASGDFTTFNNKQGAITLTTTGTSGAATLVGNTLNIPQYSGGGGGMAIGGSITSATDGSVLFAGASGVLAQDNANFFWDDTNNRLGIGTATPGVDLLVKKSATAKIGIESSGTATVETLYLQNTTDTHYVEFTNFGTTSGDTKFGLSTNGSSGLFFYPKTTGYGMLGTNTSAPLILGTNNIEGLRINTSQQIGLGTGTIGSKFQVNGNAAIGYSASTAAPTNGLAVAGQGTFGDNLTVSKNQNANTTITLSNTTSGTSSQVSFSATSDSTSGANSFGKYSTTTTAYKIVQPKDAYYYNGSVAGDFAILNDYSAGSIKFAAGGSSTAHLTLNSSGNLGLNTSTIGSKFQVNGNVAIGYSASTAAPTNGMSVAGTVNVGTNTSVTTAALQVSSTTQGFLPPVMTTTQKNAITSPATGLVVFDSTLGKLCVYSGGWQTITSV